MRGLVRIAAAVMSVVFVLVAQADVKARRDDPARNLLDRPDAELVQLYLSLTDLSLEDQRQQTWGMSSKTKAALWTYNIERYLRDHPDLNDKAQDVLRGGIRLANMPAWFDIVPGPFGYDPKLSAIAEFERRIQTLPAASHSRSVLPPGC